jgi:phosphoglycolate phosphatase
VPLIVFDLDGTLIDSQQDLADAANALILERGGTPQSKETIAAMVGEGAALLVRRALAAAHLPDDPTEALPRFLELYDERLLRTTRLYDGMQQVLDNFAADPHASLAILTNKPGRPTRRILEALGVLEIFHWVIGGDSPFGRKPNPAALQHIMAGAGCAPSDTALVGDSAIDLATARAAATRVCLARYGFGFRPDALDLRGDELIADRPEDIMPVLRQAFGESLRHSPPRAPVPGAANSGTSG